MYTICIKIFVLAVCAGLCRASVSQETLATLTTEQVHRFPDTDSTTSEPPNYNTYTSSAINEEFLVVGYPQYNQSQGRVKIWKRGVDGEWENEPSQIILGPPMQPVCNNVSSWGDNSDSSFCHRAFIPNNPGDDFNPAASYPGFYGLSFGGDVAVTENYLAVMTLRADSSTTGMSWSDTDIDRVHIGDLYWYMRGTRSVFIYELNQTSNTWVVSQQLFYATGTDNDGVMLLSMAATNNYIALSYLISGGTVSSCDYHKLNQVPIYVSERLANGTWVNTGIDIPMNISSSPYQWYGNCFFYGYSLQLSYYPHYHPFVSLSEETDSVLLAFSGLYLGIQDSSFDSPKPILVFKFDKNETSNVALMYASSVRTGKTSGLGMAMSGRILAFTNATSFNAWNASGIRTIVVIDILDNRVIARISWAQSFFGTSLALSGTQLVASNINYDVRSDDYQYLCCNSRPPVALIYDMNEDGMGFSLTRSIASSVQAPDSFTAAKKVHLLDDGCIFIAIQYSTTAYIYKQIAPEVSLDKQKVTTLPENVRGTGASWHLAAQIVNKTALGFGNIGTAVSKRFVTTATVKVENTSQHASKDQHGEWRLHTPFVQVYERDNASDGLTPRQSSHKVSTSMKIPKGRYSATNVPPKTTVSIGMTDTMLVTSTSAYYYSIYGYRVSDTPVVSMLSFYPGIYPASASSTVISIRGSISDISVTDSFIAVAVNTQWSRNVLVYEYNCVLSDYEQRYNITVENDLDYEVNSVSVNEKYLMVGITSAPYAETNRDVYTNSAPGKVKFYQYDYVARTGANRWKLQHTEEMGGWGGPNDQNWNASTVSDFGAKVALGTNMGAVLAYAPSNDKFCGSIGLQAFVYDLNTFELLTTLFSEKFGYWKEEYKRMIGPSFIAGSVALSTDDSTLFFSSGQSQVAGQISKNTYPGVVYVFHKGPSGWNNAPSFQLHPCTEEGSDCGFFGNSIHIAANNSLAVVSANTDLDNNTTVIGYSVFVYTDISPTQAPTQAPTQPPTQPPGEASKVFSIAKGSHVLSDGAIAGIVLGSVIAGVLSSALLHRFLWSASPKSSLPSEVSPAARDGDTTITFQNPLHTDTAAASNNIITSGRSSDGIVPDKIPARVRVLSEVHTL